MLNWPLHGVSFYCCHSIRCEEGRFETFHYGGPRRLRSFCPAWNFITNRSQPSSLVHVLVVERTLEVLLSDLETINTHIVAEHVTLDKQCTDKVAEYRTWWAGWQNRLSVLQCTANFLLSQIEVIDSWLPHERLVQYKDTSKDMEARLGYVIESSRSASVFGETIANRLSAWQDAVRCPD